MSHLLQLSTLKVFTKDSEICELHNWGKKQLENLGLYGIVMHGLLSAITTEFKN